MTDVSQKPVEAPEEVGAEESVELALEARRSQSLWKIRWVLFRRSFKHNWRLFWANTVGKIGLGIIVFWALMAAMPTIFFATGFWSPTVYDPITGLEPNPPTQTFTVVNQITDPATEIDFQRVLLDNRIPNDVLPGDTVEVPLQPAPPDGRHWLGTDPLGRDVLSQLMHGARAAFLLGIVAAVVTVLIGTLVGSVSAYFGGGIDGFFMRFADLLIMLPALAILIVLGSVFSYEIWHLAVVIGLLSGFGGVAIVLKSQALAVKVKPYIDAARVAGGSNAHIIFSHVVPNVMPLSFLYMMFTVTNAIQIEATLSFLGLFNPDTSWGLMIQLANNQGYLLQGLDYWWLLIPAGLSVTLLAASFFLVGRAMDEVVNPRLRKR